jgi:hypothetical protein
VRCVAEGIEGKPSRASLRVLWSCTQGVQRHTKVEWVPPCKKNSVQGPQRREHLNADPRTGEHTSGGVGRRERSTRRRTWLVVDEHAFFCTYRTSMLPD